MTTIELYKPGKWCHYIDYPTSWDELALDELRIFAHAIATNQSRQELLLLMLEMRAGKQKINLPKGWQELLNFENAAIDGLPLVDMFLDNINLTRNPFPEYEGYAGPADAFKNITVGEAEEAELHYLTYFSDRDDVHLLRLMRALWRKKMPSGLRIPFTDWQDTAMSFLLQADANTLQLVFLWYSGCRAMLPAAFPELYNGGETGDTSPVSGLTQMIHHGAGTRNGTRANIRETLLLEFLYDCQLQVINNQSNK